MNKYGKMMYNGPFSNSTKSWNGFKLDVCKSGIQKSLRRKNYDEMTWYVTEMALFYKIDQQNVLSNLINRLVIMSGEELLFADWHRFTLIHEKANLYKKNRTKHHLLFEICRLLCDGRLLRIGSDIRNTFSKGVKYDLIKVKKPVMKDKDLKLSLMFKESGDSDKLIEYFGYFMKLMKKSKDDMFYWALKIYYDFRDSDTGGKRYNKKRGVYILWKYLIYMTKENNKAKKCIKFNMAEFDRLTQSPSVKKGNEQNIFLINAILIVKNINKIKWEEEEDPFYFENEGVDFMFKRNMEDGPIEIKDCIIDMHCYEGKKKGCNGLTFAIEGSKVIDEDKEYFVQKYRDIYHNIKRIETGEEIVTTKGNTELEMIKWTELGDVYFCNEGNVCGEKMVCIRTTYKGKRVVLKECGKGVNYGIDQIIVDRMKKEVGLGDMNVCRIKMDTIVRKVDTKNKSYSDNFRVEKMEANYLMMDHFNGEMIRERKKGSGWYNSKKLRKEYIKIGLFRGIFRVTDFNELNVLVNDDNELMSIDEMLIGKKKTILGRMNAELKEKILTDYNNGQLKDVFMEIQFDNEKLKEVLKDMDCEHYYNDIIERKESIEEDFAEEMNCD